MPDRSNGEIKDLTDVMTQMGLTDIYRKFHPNTKEYAFFSAPGSFSKIDHILGKSNRIKTIGTTPVSSQSIMLKVRINNNTNCRKPTNSWKLSNTQLNHHCVSRDCTFISWPSSPASVSGRRIMVSACLCFLPPRILFCLPRLPKFCPIN